MKCKVVIKIENMNGETCDTLVDNVEVKTWIGQLDIMKDLIEVVKRYKEKK